MDSDSARDYWLKKLAKMSFASVSLTAEYSYRPERPPEPRGETAALPCREGAAALELIARGGMGEVFRARQEELEREVAIKKLRADHRSPTARASFLAEAVVTGSLEHPNIVPVYGLSTDPSAEVCLSMKLVEGETWKQQVRVSRKGELTYHLGILVQVCNAIAFAHSRSIAHNDLKPENVMIGAFGEVLVLDWGLAVSFLDEPVPGSRVRHRTCIRSPAGTPAYMAPELAAGKGARLGPWTDVYLLGAILYELLAGRPPHDGGSLREVIAQALSGEPPPLPEDAPPSLRALCRRALAFLPADRPSVEELREELRAYLEHRESLEIAQAARATLQACGASELPVDEAERKRLYTRYAEAVAGFRQALVLWKENADARAGERDAHLGYARCALALGDLGLAEAQLRELPAPEPTLSAAVREARAVREAERRQRLWLRRGLLGATVVLLVGLSVGLFVLDRKNAAIDRERARVAAQNVELETAYAVLQREEERSARRSAVAQTALTDLTDEVHSRLVTELGDRRAKALADDLLRVARRGWVALREAGVGAPVTTRGDLRVRLRAAQLELDDGADPERIAAELAAVRAGFRALYEAGSEVEALTDLCRALFLEGGLLLRLGRLGEGRERFVQARELCVGRLAAGLPETPRREVEELLAFALEGLADCAWQQRRLGEVLALHREVLALRKEEVGGWHRRSQRARTWANIAEAHEALGAWEEAEAAYTQAVAGHRALCAERPDAAAERFALTTGLLRAASLCQRRGELDEARALVEEALGVARGLFERDPDGLENRRRLALCLRRLAGLETASGALDAAEERLAAADALLRPLVQALPGDVELAGELVSGLTERARLLRLRGADGEAAEVLGEGTALLEAGGYDPSHAEARFFLARLALARSAVLADAGELAEAARLASEALDELEAQARSAPEGQTLAWALRAAASCLSVWRQQGRREFARARVEPLRELLAGLEQRPENPSFRRDLVDFLFALAEVEPEPARCVDFLEQALEEARALFLQTRDEVLLGKVFLTLAHLRVGAGDAAARVRLCEEQLAFLAPLDAVGGLEVQALLLRAASQLETGSPEAAASIGEALVAVFALPPAECAAILPRAGELLLMIGDFLTLFDICEQGLARLDSEAPDAHAGAAALHELRARALEAVGDAAAAEAAIDSAIARRLQDPDPVELASLYRRAAGMAERRGDPVRAERLHAACVAQARAVPPDPAGRRQLANALQNQAVQLHDAGRVDEARPLFEESLAMHLALVRDAPGDPWDAYWASLCLDRLATMAYREGDLARTEELGTRARDLLAGEVEGTPAFRGDLERLNGQLRQLEAEIREQALLAGAAPSSPLDWELVGLQHYHAGRFAEAVAAFEKMADVPHWNRSLWIAASAASQRLPAAGAAEAELRARALAWLGGYLDGLRGQIETMRGAGPEAAAGIEQLRGYWRYARDEDEELAALRAGPGFAELFADEP